MSGLGAPDVAGHGKDVDYHDFEVHLLQLCTRRRTAQDVHYATRLLGMGMGAGQLTQPGTAQVVAPPRTSSLLVAGYLHSLAQCHLLGLTELNSITSMHLSTELGLS